MPSILGQAGYFLQNQSRGFLLKSLARPATTPLPSLEIKAASKLILIVPYGEGTQAVTVFCRTLA